MVVVSGSIPYAPVNRRTSPGAASLLAIVENRELCAHNSGELCDAAAPNISCTLICRPPGKGNPKTYPSIVAVAQNSAQLSADGVAWTVARGGGIFSTNGVATLHASIVANNLSGYGFIPASQSITIGPLPAYPARWAGLRKGGPLVRKPTGQRLGFHCGTIVARGSRRR